MPNPDPCFSHLSHASREEVFGRLHKALNDLATYIPSARQNPYWKTRVVNRIWRKWERWAFMNGWSDDYYFPAIEKCFESVLEELGILAQVSLLDPRLQIEVVSFRSEGFPVLAFFPVQQHGWITEQIEVRPATEVLVLLSQPEIERLPVKVVTKQLKHELGHALLYLRDPKAQNDCSAAGEEWERSTKMEDFIK
jgi:hypothetical protein